MSDEPRKTRAKAGGAPKEPAFLFVGIGASAGGVEAFRQFLGGLTPDMSMAYFLILHMGEVKSILTEILARDTSLPVVEVQDGMRAKSGTVYVMPSGSDMVIEHGVLRLHSRAAGSARHVPIDTFLRSLADDQGPRAIGVVLTGADSDGMLGMGAIKANGGVTLAQDPDTAAYPSMPAALDRRSGRRPRAPHPPDGRRTEETEHPPVVLACVLRGRCPASGHGVVGVQQRPGSPAEEDRGRFSEVQRVDHPEAHRQEDGHPTFQLS